MKYWIAFAGGVLAGTLVMIPLRPDHSAALAAAKKEAGAAKTALEEARLKIARAEAGRTSAPSPGARPGPAVKGGAKAKPGDVFGKKFAEMIQQFGKVQIRAQVDAKLQQIVERLALTPEQKAKLMALVGADAEALSDAMGSIMGGKAPSGDAQNAMALVAGKLPAEVEASLTPEQKAEYAKFQEEERTNRIETRANAELLGMGAIGGLTQDQKDQAFQKLCEIAEEEDRAALAPDAGTAAPGDAMEKHAARRIEALRGILTEPQMKAYETQVDMQRRMMKELGLQIKIQSSPPAPPPTAK